MKKSVALIAVLLIFVLSGCAYSAAKTYYRGTDDYNEIWKLAGLRHGYDDKSPLFPDEIDDLEVKDFYCRYDEQLPLGEGVQIFLEIAYDDTSFDSEQKRISETAVEDKENFTDSRCSAYSLKMGENGCWEYALTDDSQNMVYYIFLYNLPEEEIEIDKNFLPENYVDYIQ